MKKFFIVFLFIFMASCFGGDNKNTTTQEINTGEVIETPTESIIQEGGANTSEIRMGDNAGNEIIPQ